MHKIRKLTPFLFFLLITLTTPIGVYGLGIGPPTLELDVPVDGFNKTVVYVTSDGITGNLIIGSENLPFTIRPDTFPLSPDDVNTPIEITIYGNSTIDSGQYDGKLTFIGMTGDTVAMGIKIRIEINHYKTQTGLSFMGLNQNQIIIIVGVIVVVSIILLYRNKSSKTGE